MPSKKKKYNARFPAGRIKKIMQTDEEVGKVAQAVPVIISRTLELFVESLLTKSMQITQARNARTLTPSHMKQCILSENRFDFLRDLVNNIPDASAQEDNENNLLFEANIENKEAKSSSASTSNSSRPHTSQNSSVHEPGTSRKSSTVIRYGPNVTQNTDFPTTSSNSSRRESVGGSSSNSSYTSLKRPNTLSVQSMENDTDSEDDNDNSFSQNQNMVSATSKLPTDAIPPLIPISNSFYTQNRSDSLVIDEDYDN